MIAKITNTEAMPVKQLINLVIESLKKQSVCNDRDGRISIGKDYNSRIQA